ncbi:MAG: hypothetical protein DCC67_16795 [Planctomycetota bacterium]|nr:MAG: hypothetical protein DCC67_16795 [Planctomycetota bacterium]
MLHSGPPTEPSSPEFGERVAGAGAAFGRAGVAAVYLIHGTFAGNDALGLATELERLAPRLAQALRRCGKRTLDLILGETGNYTPRFAARMEQSLSRGAGRSIPVRLFHWSSLNNHIGRADAAIRLLDELATFAQAPIHHPPLSKGGAGGGVSAAEDAADRATSPHVRVLLWSHSHGGNVVALATNLLGADDAARSEFFAAAGAFYRGGWTGKPAFPAWQRVEELLARPEHPLRRLQLDVVNFGTPIRYGWDSSGYAKLLHVTNHRPREGDADYLARYPVRCAAVLSGRAGDFVQQLGIAGSNLPPLPLALQTFLANRRLGSLLERQLPPRLLTTRMKAAMRVPEEGVTLLVDYDDPDRLPHRHLLGHAPYTRSRWLPLHCELVAQEFYGTDGPE